MSEVIERVRQLPGLVAGMLPHATDIRQLSNTELTDLVSVLGGALSALQRSAALAAAVIDERSARELGAESLARKAGVKSGAELVQKLTGSSLGDAKKAVRVGVMLETAAAVSPVESGDASPGPRSIGALAAVGGDWAAPVAVAVRNGWLSAECGDRLKTGLGTPRDDASTPAFRAAVLRLIEDCWDGELTPEALERAAKAVRASLDKDWAQNNGQRLYEQRSLKRTVRGDGMVKYDLLVDPLTDAQLWTPIFRHLSPRLGGPRFLTDEERARAAELQQDARTNEQLLADTFTAFLIAGVTTGGVFGKYTPTVNIAVTTGELKKGITADRARQNASPTAADGSPPPEADPPPDGIAWLDGAPHAVSGPQLIAALCDGSIAGILLDQTGQAIDATKAERTFSARQRRAMAIRDGGCLMPACTMPPEATEAHHINPWSEHPDNQKTETRDGVLLCKADHLNLHNHGGRIQRRGSTYWLIWPGQEPIRLQPKHALIAQLRTQGDIA
ncbi:hypothetical protein GCM10022286_23440 [Gryllotalpicola daejeonensis]|uniref:HNH nuclease domain-containing protein n=1 Tax=Gryllotalpicola daejeonensis TaxID=993087 RepID=A0ABP7ZLN1_9MICO